MEKIKAAIAKAKLQNLQLKTTSNVVFEASKTQLKLPSTESEGELGFIEYMDTSIIKLDPVCLEKHRIVSHAKHDINSNIFDSLRTQILLKMEENNWRTLAVVSPTPAAGKTFVSINLAISIAHQPKKTAVLVDLDLRRPKVANYLGIHAEKSMNDYLQGNAKLQDIMVNPSISRLVIIPTMRPVSKSAEILSSNKVVNLIQELRERYDSRMVIFDAPPVLNSDDAMVLLPQVDCFLLVIANGMSTQSEIEETMYHLPQEKLVGVVLNKADVESRAYYY